jgi:outer membrane protein insertion porin family
MLWWTTRVRARLTTIVMSLCLTGWVASALAQDAGRDLIREIRVEGVERIDPETVRSYMQLSVGDPFAPDKIDKAQKALFATDLFASVTFQREGGTLIVKVVENPIINQTAFQGNDSIKTEDLLNEIREKPRTVLAQSRVQADVQRIFNLYRRSAWFGTTVDPEIIKRDHQNRVDLVFVIKEGNRSRVRKISFVGNSHFCECRLRRIIVTTESAWYRVVTTDTYDADRLLVDRDKLRDFYLQNGYINFRVISVVAEPSPKLDAFYITFTLSEGERYKVGKVDLKTSLKDLDPAVLRSLVQVKEGDWYDQRDVDKTTSALNDAFGSLGYAFVDVQTRLDRDQKTHTVNIAFSINEGPKVYVERIDIKGNMPTLDSVIRREFRLVEGDAFNSAKLQLTKQRLTNLGYFSKVGMKVLPGGTPDMAIIVVNVEEQSTGGLNLGLGFSATDGPFASFDLNESNFMGRGQSIVANIELTRGGTTANVSFADPYFTGRPIPAKWGVSFITGSPDDWKSLVTGFQLTMWAGVLVFHMPLVLLYLLQGAYYSYLWSDDVGRRRRRFMTMMDACKLMVLLQVSYVVGANIINGAGAAAEYASNFICG